MVDYIIGRTEVYTPSGIDVLPVPRIRLSDRARTKFFAADLKMSRTHAMSVYADLGLEDVDLYGDMPASVMRGMWRFLVHRAEEAIQSGVLPPAPPDTIATFYVTEENHDALVALCGDKRCDYQRKEGRDLYCAAAALEDKTRKGLEGLSVLAPTTTPLCNACALPDSDFVCSHLTHPEVVGIVAGGHVVQRRLTAALCERDRDEISNPERCVPGGNPCWERGVRPLPVEVPIDHPPSALPEAFDSLDSAWRLAFDKKRALVRNYSASAAAGLAASCEGRTDFESRMSDLADVLKSLDVPDELIEGDDKIERGHTITRLLACLKTRLDESDFARVEQAAEKLRVVNDIRTSLQHSKTKRSLEDSSRSSAFTTWLLGGTSPGPECGAMWSKLSE